MGILQKSRLVLLVTTVMVLGAALWIQTVYGATWEAEAQNREGYGKICRISHEEQSVDLISMKAGKSEDKAASEKENPAADAGDCGSKRLFLRSGCRCGGQ